jgi:hypothetical protein
MEMNRFHLRSRSLVVLLAGILAVAAATFLLLPGRASPAVNTTLTAYISDGPDHIWLKDASGAIVTYLPPGTYTIEVTDTSSVGNFHLTGPGVDLKTGLGEVENVTWTVTFTEGRYHFQCDFTPFSMFGNFAVGNTPPPPPPPPRSRCTVPNVVGMRLGRARSRIGSAHCSVGTVRRKSSRRVGRVIGQRPRPGAIKRRGYPIALVVGRR